MADNLPHHRGRTMPKEWEDKHWTWKMTYSWTMTAGIFGNGIFIIMYFSNINNTNRFTPTNKTCLLFPGYTTAYKYGNISNI